MLSTSTSSKRKRIDEIDEPTVDAYTKPKHSTDSIGEESVVEQKRTRLRIVTDLPGGLTSGTITQLAQSAEEPDHDNIPSAVPSVFDEIDSTSSLFSQFDEYPDVNPSDVSDQNAGSEEMTTQKQGSRTRAGSVSPNTDFTASRTPPPIRGLFFTDAVRLPEDLAEEVMSKCLSTYFKKPDVNQIMLFGRTTANDLENPAHNGGLPTFLTSLLSTVAVLLHPVLPQRTHELLFPPSTAPPRARQVILNLYRAGEGITPHVDLLKRFGDGIIGISLGSGCVMTFRKELQPAVPSGVPQGPGRAKEEEGKKHGHERWDLYLPERSVLVLSEEARYDWTHGIDGRVQDVVEVERGSHTEADGVRLERSVRLSITFRWLLPGADIVGGSD